MTIGHTRVEVREESIASLVDYARIPIAFEVRRVFDVIAPGGDPVDSDLEERELDVPYWKDYDALDGGGPSRLVGQFDVSNWVVLSARVGPDRVGGAIVAFDTPGVWMLEGRRDLAVVWDIRVLPEARGRGVGTALFRAAEAWAVARGCRQLKVETQNINVPACQFYRRQGCVLRRVNPLAYPELPDEVQLLWYKEVVA